MARRDHRQLAILSKLVYGVLLSISCDMEEGVLGHAGGDEQNEAEFISIVGISLIREKLTNDRSFYKYEW